MTDQPVRIATYHNVTSDGLDFARGPFRLEVYQHPSRPITYVVRTFHDVTECTAYTSPGGRIAYAEQVAANEAVDRATFDIRAELFRVATERLDGFLATEAMKEPGDVG